MKTIVLLSDSNQDSPDDNWLTHQASIALARLSQNRQCRFVLISNSSTTISVMMALGEYHSPPPLELNETARDKVIVFRPLDLKKSTVSPTGDAETRWLREQENLNASEGGLLESLAYLAGCFDLQETINRDSPKFRWADSWQLAMLLDKFCQGLRENVVVFKIGSDNRLREHLDAIFFRARYDKLTFYFDEPNEGIGKSNRVGYSIESVFDKFRDKFKENDTWLNSLRIQPEDQKNDLTSAISVAQKLARFSLAFELIIDRLGD